jgi:hypothetical protein
LQLNAEIKTAPTADAARRRIRTALSSSNLEKTNQLKNFDLLLNRGRGVAAKQTSLLLTRKQSRLWLEILN